MAGAADGLTPQDAFVDAFERNRLALAGFARCGSVEDLHRVRDGWHLGLGKLLCPTE